MTDTSDGVLSVATRFAATDAFSLSQGNRPNTRDVFLLVTVGEGRDVEEATIYSRWMKDAGVQVILRICFLNYYCQNSDFLNATSNRIANSHCNLIVLALTPTQTL